MAFPNCCNFPFLFFCINFRRHGEKFSSCGTKKFEFYSKIDLFIIYGVYRTPWPSVMGLSALAYELLEVGEPKVNDLCADQRSVNSYLARWPR